MSKTELACSTFYCDLRGGRYCCAYCPDPCSNRCLNHPDRCNLAVMRTPIVPKRAPRLEPEQQEELTRLIKEGKHTNKQIAEMMGISAPAVSWHKARIKQEQEKERAYDKTEK